MTKRKFFTFPHCGTDIFLLSVFTIAFSSYRMLLHQFFPLIPTCNQYYITFFGTTMCIGFYFVRKKDLYFDRKNIKTYTYFILKNDKFHKKNLFRGFTNYHQHFSFLLKLHQPAKSISKQESDLPKNFSSSIKPNLTIFY